MASASSIIGSLQVNITASTAGIQKAFQGTQKMIGGFVNKASLVGGAISAAFGGMLKVFESNGSQLEELSKATGIAVDELSFLKYAAIQSGAGIEELTKAARGLITKGIDPNRFEEIASKIAGIQDPVMRAQTAMYYFGKKSALAILPMLSDLPKLKERFEQLGGGITEKMAKAAKALGDSWGNVKLVLANVTDHIAFALAPTITKISEYIANNGKQIVQWIDDHQKLILIVGGAAAALTALAPVLFGLNQAIRLTSSSIVGANAAFGLATTGVGGLKSAFDLFVASPVLIFFSAIASAAIDLTLILKGLEDRAVSTWQAISQTGNALGGVGGYVPKAHFAASAITPDGTQPSVVAPTTPQSLNASGYPVPPSSGNTDSMTALLQTMNKHLEKIAGDSPTENPMGAVVISPVGVR